MKRVPCLVASTVVIALLAGCASIVKGTKQQMAVTSNVDGATLYLDGQDIGTTPFNGIVPKNKTELRVEKEGYKTETIVLSKTLEAMFWGNIIIGGTLGSLTDFATGAAYAYAPATYQVDLKKDGQALLEYQHQLAARKFSMIYADQISRDLQAGDGEYLSTLVTILHEAGSDADLEDVRGAMIASGGDQVSFGKQVVALL